MNIVYKCCKNNNILIKKIKYINNYIVVYDDKNSMFLLNLKFNRNKDIFDYFDRIYYHNYLPLLNNYQDNYELCNYYDDKFDDKIKVKNIMDVLIDLHKKSITFFDISKEWLNDLYNSKLKEINNLMNYYLDLQDYIEQFAFPRWDYYFLINNISLFYQILNIARDYLEKWNIIKTLKIRKCMNIGNLSLKNSIMNDKLYFIDYSMAGYDLNIYDLVTFYKEYVCEFDIDLFMEKYFSNLDVSYSEKLLFYVFISIPERLVFTNDIYSNFLSIKKSIDYVMKTLSFLLEEDKKYQETNK